MSDDFREAALQYHRLAPAGKLRIQATKPLASQHDLSLAYSPGVAVACEEIVRDPREAFNLTARGNLVAVVTNGTAVLGMGPIGALAAKPVMEGKAVLFKKFAGIDAFDIEIEERDPQRLVNIIAGLEATFGAINLEDIRAPECFEVETRLRERLGIPVFHDDQHGTAIVTGAAVLNSLRLVDKKFEDVRVVVSGAGAAALACLDLLVTMGVRRENVIVTDREGVVYAGREFHMDPYKARYAVDTSARTLAEVIDGADIFLGLSAGGVLKREMVRRMADKPLILALANPIPEIMPEEARAERPDAIIATGRSDYPNQVNNVLCFPFIFRGALDVGATAINEAMKVACVEAIANIAMEESTAEVAAAYSGQTLTFGADHILPKPFDSRLITRVPPAVAKAAVDSGVATRPMEDADAYRRRLSQIVYRSGNVMQPVFLAAREDPKRLIFSEGEDDRVLRAVQVVCDERYAEPIVIGRGETISERIRRMGLRIRPDVHFRLIDPVDFDDFDALAGEYHALNGRQGVQLDAAAALVRTRPTVLGSLLLARGEADALLAGPVQTFHEHLRQALSVVGLAEGVHVPAAMQLLILETGTYFLADSYVNYDPSAEQLAEITLLAARQVSQLRINPRVALVSHSNFGSVDNPSTVKLRETLNILRERAPELEVDGEMQFDAAVMREIRMRILPDTTLKGRANLFMMPTLDAASITFNALKVLANGVSVGPILLGAGMPVHILSRTVTARGVVNMSALAVVDAQERAKHENPFKIPAAAAQ